jgi:hypothetical protein
MARVKVTVELSPSDCEMIIKALGDRPSELRAEVVIRRLRAAMDEQIVVYRRRPAKTGVQMSGDGATVKQTE